MEGIKSAMQFDAVQGKLLNEWWTWKSKQGQEDERMRNNRTFYGPNNPHLFLIRGQGDAQIVNSAGW